MESFLNKKEIWILRIIYILSFVVVVMAIYYDHQKYNSYTEKIDAQIIGVEKVKHTDDDGTYYRYMTYYTFTLNGTVYKNEQELNYENEEGNYIHVYYQPKNPQKNYIEVKEEPWEAIIAIIIFLIIHAVEESYINYKLSKVKWDSVEKEMTVEKTVNKRYMNTFLIILALTVFYTVMILPKQLLIFEALFSYGSCLISLCIFLIVYERNKTLKKVLNDSILLEDIKNSKEIKSSYQGSVYFSKEQLISINFEIQKILYIDIILVGAEKCEDSDAPYTHNVLVITKDFKKHFISNGDLSSQQEIANEIKKNVPNVLDGYTPENKGIVEEMKKRASI